ncbi:MAG: transcription antitermination factor NusB [Oscillospiraceae bacterium]|nr:transcription antitermination factor NusB [Oscillospiraceae bacterium]
MTRSDAREIAVHLIYAVQCTEEDPRTVIAARFDETYYSLLSEENEVYAEAPKQKQRAYISSVVLGVCEHREELEGYLAKHSIGWNVSRISRLARACMELAMYEALYVEDVPINVAINEAVKLVQKYEEPETVAFVNGVLGAFSRERGNKA